MLGRGPSAAPTWPRTARCTARSSLPRVCFLGQGTSMVTVIAGTQALRDFAVVERAYVPSSLFAGSGSSFGAAVRATLPPRVGLLTAVGAASPMRTEGKPVLRVL